MSAVDRQRGFGLAKLSVFVACPYMLFPLDDYKKTFQSVTKSFDVEFKFADEQITNQHVLQKVTNYIRDHSFSLFDITGWNPNVALELGIAVGLGQRYFILLNTKIDQNRDVPSDIKGLDRIQYSSNSELEAKLLLLIKQEQPLKKSRSDSAFEALKEQILDALRASPGIGLTKLSDLIQEDKSLVQSTIRALVQTDEITTSGQKKGTVYYAAEGALGEQTSSG